VADSLGVGLLAALLLAAPFIAPEENAEVAGMVLVDSTEPTSQPQAAGSANDGGSYDALGRASALGPASARVGLARLVGNFGYDSLPSWSRDEVRASSATANYRWTDSAGL
jgi:hypothetical protein